MEKEVCRYIDPAEKTMFKKFIAWLKSIFRPEPKPVPVWTPEPIEADPVAHALEQLDSDVRLGKTSVEERVAILNAMLAPRLDRIEEALHHE